MKNCFQTFQKLVVEAYGCRRPTAETTWLGAPLDRHYQTYAVRLRDWDVEFVATMPTLDVLVRISVRRPQLTPEMPWEQMEAYLQSFAFDAVDAVGYALCTIAFQPPHVIAHLHGRFGPRLGEARELASQRVQSTVDAARR